MDGSAADGEHPVLGPLLHAVIIQRLRRTTGTSKTRPPPEKGCQEGRGQAVGQEIGQEIGQEVRSKGRPEVGPEVYRQENGQALHQKEHPAQRQAREIRCPQGVGQIRIAEASQEGRAAAALTADQPPESSRARAAAQLIRAM